MSRNLENVQPEPVGPAEEIRVLVVEDLTLYRRGIVTVLDLEPGIRVVGEAGTAAVATRLILDLRPDVVLLDIYLPDGNGVQVCQTVTAQLPSTRVLMLTASDDGDDLARAITAGATGYLLKDLGPDGLVAAIRGAHHRQAQLSPALGAVLMERYSQLVRQRPVAESGETAHELLTDRERQVLAQVGRGLSNRAVADRLFISEFTVKNHVRSILEKLDVDSRVKAAMYAARHGLVAADTPPAPPPADSPQHPEQ